MKKKLFSLSFLVAVVPMVLAQSPVNILSAISHSPNCLGTGVVVRNYGSNQILVHHTDASDQHIHHFALQGHTDTNFLEVVAVLGHSGQIGDTTYVINDMRILGDTCYFCGKCTFYYGAPVYDVEGHITHTSANTRGMLGHFSIADMTTGSITMNTTIVPQTETLTRLAVQRDVHSLNTDYDIMFSAIGQDIDGGRSFVVEAGLASASGWQLSVSGLTSSDDEEIFTDIAAVGSSTLVASEVADGAGGSHVLHMHESMQGCFYNEYAQPSMAETIISYDFSSVGGNWGWHRIGSEVRMCPTSNNEVAIAFASQNQPDGSEGIITARWSSTGSLGCPYFVNSSPNASVAELQYLSQGGKLNMLLKNSTYFNGCVYSCAISMASGNTVDVVSKQGVRLLSLCCYNNSMYTASGFDVLTTRVTNLWNTPLMQLQHICMEVAHESVAKLRYCSTDKLSCDWSVVISRCPIIWEVLDCLVQPMEQEIACQFGFVE